MAAYEFDCAWCGKHVALEEFRGHPQKFCCKRCCNKAYEARRGGKKQEPKERPGPLVPLEKCEKCRFSSRPTGEYFMCAYHEIMGHSRTSLHPEGLTSDCKEYQPRRRSRKTGSLIERK